MKVALILPAYNEELSICETIKDFYTHDPEIYIHVVNNASEDRTEELSKEIMCEMGIKGHVTFEPEKGKGVALKTGLRGVDADIYIIVDADFTYQAKDLARLIKPITSNRADIVIGDRISLGDYERLNKRKFHNFGNRLVCSIIGLIYNTKINDVMSGYRVMSRDYVKLLPIISKGFQVETEITLHTLEHGFRYLELPISYRERLPGSYSKLNTYKDGLRVISLIFNIFRYYKPLQFFGSISILLTGLSVIFGGVVIIEYLKTGFINRIPMAILASGLGLLGSLVFFFGLMMDALQRVNKINFELLKNKK